MQATEIEPEQESKVDWNSFEQIGWIPCIGGEIFFENCQVGLGEYDFFVGNYLSDLVERHNSRKLVISSVVDWQDTKNILRPDRGRYRAVMLGELTRDQSTFAGTVNFIEKYDPAQSFYGQALAFFRPRSNTVQEQELLDSLSEFCDLSSTSSNNELYEELETKLDQFEDPSCFSVEFQLDRTGLIQLRYKGGAYDPKRLSPESSEVADPETGDIQDQLVVRQAYYYLKYAFHTHAHHSAQAESLTTVHPSSEEGAKNIVKDLKRGINDRRVHSRESTYTESGIAIYASSLLKSCENAGWLTNDAEVQANYLYFRNLEKSMELQGIPEQRTVVKIFFSRLLVNSLCWFVLVGPIFLYLNSRGRGLTRSEIESEVMGFFGGASSMGNDFLDELVASSVTFIHLYVEGIVAPAITCVISFFLVAIVTTVLTFDIAHLRGRTGVARGVFRYIGERATSYSSSSSHGGLTRILVGRFFYWVVLAKNFFRKFVSPYFHVSSEFRIHVWVLVAIICSFLFLSVPIMSRMLFSGLVNLVS